MSPSNGSDATAIAKIDMHHFLYRPQLTMNGLHYMDIPLVAK